MHTTDTNRDGAGAGDKHDPLIELLPRVWRESRWQRLWRPFWMLPTCILVAAAVLGLVLPLLDRGMLAVVAGFIVVAIRTVGRRRSPVSKHSNPEPSAASRG